MIVFNRVTAGSDARSQSKPVLTAVDIIIPSDRRIALVGATRDETKILFNLLAGIMYPREGQILRKASISFPVGYLGGFVKKLTVRTNVSHLARIYGADVKTTVNFVEGSTRLRQSFDKPYGELPRKSQRKLAAILAYTIPFDVYLLSQEDVRGKLHRGNIALQLFTQRNRSAGMIIASTDAAFAAEYCDMAMVLKEQKLTLCESIDDAFKIAGPPARGARQKDRGGEGVAEELVTEDQPTAEAALEGPAKPDKEARAAKPSEEELQARKAARRAEAKQARQAERLKLRANKG